MSKGDNKQAKIILIGAVIFMIIILLLLLTFAWLLTKGLNDQQSVPEETKPSSSKNIPPEPTNPNVTGGSDAGGTNRSNDNTIQSPSPAGGVDTNANTTQ